MLFFINKKLDPIYALNIISKLYFEVSQFSFNYLSLHTKLMVSSTFCMYCGNEASDWSWFIDSALHSD